MATIGFEEKLWQAADKLRGSMHSAAVLSRANYEKNGLNQCSYFKYMCLT